MSEETLSVPRLASFPVSFFAMVMGMAGLRSGTDAYRYIGLGLLGLLTLIVALLLVRTGVAVWRRAICVPGH
jgi:tellurite resistance protein